MSSGRRSPLGISCIECKKEASQAMEAAAEDAAGLEAAQPAKAPLAADTPLAAWRW